MLASTIAQTPTQSLPCAARQLDGHQRRELALAVMGRRQRITRLAAQQGVSRGFCYRQAGKAQAALDDAFIPVQPDQQVLFYLPVTPAWIKQFVLAQVLIGHSSDRAVLELSRILLDYHNLSLGTIHNILAQTAQRAEAINRDEDLSGIRVAAFDEIYQARHPTLAGMDLKSTYCFLLSSEEVCDQTTWGVRLLELSEQRGLKLDYSIADGGRALRAAQAQVWPEVPCHGDVFHPLREMEDVAGFCKHRAEAALAALLTLRRRMERLGRDGRRSLNGERIRTRLKLSAAEKELRRAQSLHEDLAVLSQWMRRDVLGRTGDDEPTRRELFEFVVSELRQREMLCPHRLTPLRRGLQEQTQPLLAFAQVLQREWSQIARELAVPPHLVRATAALASLDVNQSLYWQRRALLAGKLGHRFGEVEAAVKRTLAGVPRASSLVENLNSRLRCYFFLWRRVSRPYLELLRFYFNHRRFARSRCSQRVGQSPYQLLSGSDHPHWLEMLGYPLLHRN
jgi:hypothetical protein